MTEIVWVAEDGDIAHIGEWDDQIEPIEVVDQAEVVDQTTGEITQPLLVHHELAVTNPRPDDLTRQEQDVTTLEDGTRVLASKAYRYHRRAAYPPVAHQLDALYHGGYDGWKKWIDEIKEQYPKPEDH